MFSSGAFLALALIAAVRLSGIDRRRRETPPVGIIFKSIVSTVKEAVSPRLLALSFPITIWDDAFFPPML